MQILIAPDKFKESLTAQKVAAAIRDGFRSVFAEASFDLVPVADGGEGTAGIFLEALGGRWVEVDAHDPLGRPIMASYAWIDERQTRRDRHECRFGTLARCCQSARSVAREHLWHRRTDGRCDWPWSGKPAHRPGRKRHQRRRSGNGRRAGLEIPR